MKMSVFCVVLKKKICFILLCATCIFKMTGKAFGTALASGDSEALICLSFAKNLVCESRISLLNGSAKILFNSSLCQKVEFFYSAKSIEFVRQE